MGFGEISIPVSALTTLGAVEGRLIARRAPSISGGRLGWSGQCKDIHPIVFISCMLTVRGILEIGQHHTSSQNSDLAE